MVCSFCMPNIKEVRAPTCPDFLTIKGIIPPISPIQIDQQTIFSSTKESDRKTVPVLRIRQWALASVSSVA